MSIIIALLYYMLKLYRSYSGWHKKTVKKRHAGLLENGCIAVYTKKIHYILKISIRKKMHS